MPAGPGTSRGGNRVHLAEQNREVLVKLGVARRMEFSYRKGTMAPLWGKIRALLRVEIDKDLKNPDTTIRQLVNERQAVVAVQKKESRTVETDTELDQNLDLWIKRENELLCEQEDAKKPKEIYIERLYKQQSIGITCWYHIVASDTTPPAPQTMEVTALKLSYQLLRGVVIIASEATTRVEPLPCVILRSRLRKPFKRYDVCAKKPAMRITVRKTSKSTLTLLMP